jgi:Kef-type K+ transport system membrane component KefB
MRVWMAALVGFILMLGCIVVLWIGALRQSPRNRAKLTNVAFDTLVFLVLIGAALRSNLPWNGPISTGLVIGLLLLAAGAAPITAYAARLYVRRKQRSAKTTHLTPPG